MKFENELKINSLVSHYNHKKYWKMRTRLYLGARENGESFFKEAPHVPHGIKGIFISDYVHIGKGATLFQQVTIGIKDYDHGLDKVPTLGDNVTVGAGAKVLGPIKIGNNVTIGANAVV